MKNDNGQASKSSILFENIGSIKKANIGIADEALNVKFGPNGIGKTTLIKALKYKLSQNEELKEVLKPFDDASKEPAVTISGALDGKNIAVYDVGYFNSLFSKQDDLLEDTYSFVIKSQDYENQLNAINGILSDIINIAKKSEFGQFLSFYINATKSKSIIYKKGTSGVPSDKSLFKSFAKIGIQLPSPESSSGLRRYERYFKSPYSAQWLKWLENYNTEWTNGNVCPFCGEEFKQGDLTLNKNLENIKKFTSSKEAGENIKERNLISQAVSYSEGALSDQISNILSQEGKAAAKTLEPFDTFLQTLDPAIAVLNSIRASNAISIIQKWKREGSKLDALRETLSGFLLPEAFVVKDSVTNENLVHLLNNKISSALGRISDLQTEAEKISSAITAKADETEKLINDFLAISGTPYKVKIVGKGDVSFQTSINPAVSQDSDITPNRLNYLSYGEANALAILIFAIQHRDFDGLIVLDDPISSFDNNKRYAIFHYIFKKENKLLNGKTVLLMTHDFQTVVTLTIPLKASLGRSFSNVTFSSLTKVGKELREEQFGRNDIESSLVWYENYAKERSADLLSRIVAARRIIEIKGVNNDIAAYDCLSSLIHGRTDPTKLNKDKLSEVEKNSGSQTIGGLLGEAVTYDGLLKKISDINYLYAEYTKPNASRFSKACIARFLSEKYLSKHSSLTKSGLFSVATNFMNDVYHVETQFIYSIKSLEQNNIPEYIISFCDTVVNNIYISN